MLKGYLEFRDKYAGGDHSIMRYLSDYGQKPEVMFVACCDSRVDPALILQCDPGDLFVVRNVANIVPPYEKDEAHHGTSAALEFGVCFLKVKHLILLGHSQCGGIKALLDNVHNAPHQNDFIDNWVSIIKPPQQVDDVNTCAQYALQQSKANCLTFPWLAARVAEGTLKIHLWFFDIHNGQIYNHNENSKEFEPL